MRQIFPLLIAALLGSTAAPLWAQTAPSDQTALPAITVSKVQSRELRDIVLASGLISPLQQIQVVPLIEGQPIEALLADVGDTVVEGQVLARLSSSTLTLQKAQLTASIAAARAQIAQAEAQVLDATSSAAEAQRVADRTKALKTQGTASQAATDQATAAAVSASSRIAVATQSAEAAKAQLALVEAQIANVDLQLSRTEVKAPFAGEITARNAQLGAVASAQGQPMFTLIRDNALELRADVAETDLARIQLGQSVEIRLVGATAPVAGVVRLIEPSIDPVTRLGRVRISFEDTSAIRSGMYAEASILLRDATVVSVPITALGRVNGQTQVLSVKDGQARSVVVTTGMRDGGWVEISQGLSEGDTVVTKAGAFVRDGDYINPIAAEAAATN
ncbi:efflux RND transporter periplasmic adaptor subunit [Cypionkella sp.]|uniref:efflux RND transporter periplasmic adaptor subunit n=1 Tax=Cypionkella sp. TaxID=2811411 RepID=UPI0037516F35